LAYCENEETIAENDVSCDAFFVEFLKKFKLSNKQLNLAIYEQAQSGQ
jgi:hypothetical protein